MIAKELDATYKPGQRKGMVKVKRVRTIDCVVMGWRPGKHEGTVGSLILGLYENGKLRPIGHTSGLKAKEKKELVEDARSRTRRARRAPATRAAGTPTGSSSGSRCAPSSWSR